MNFKVFENEGNTTLFNCTKACPPDFPHKVFAPNAEDDHDPYCSAEAVANQRLEGTNSNWPIVGGVIGIVAIFLIFLVFFAHQRVRARHKESVAKMAQVFGRSVR